MSKNILIISSNFTGHGHKSITESLCEKFSIKGDTKIHIVDGFSLGGKALLSIGKSYGPITRNAKNLWKLIWDLSSINPMTVNKIIGLVIEHNLLELIEKVKPDLILSVHPNFNGSVIDILEKHSIKIPFVTFIADLVSIYPLWADKRADYIISPTVEAKEKCIMFGAEAERIKVLGFPVRSRFCNSTATKSPTASEPLKCLIMSGGEGVGNMKRIAEILLDNFDCSVKIIAGRNENMKNKLENSLSKKYGDKAEIYGFLENVQDLMVSCDIAFTRGSPNVMMEAISCNLPLVITGALPGQEEGNPFFAEKHNLGVVCHDIENIKNIIYDLQKNDCEKLNEIKDAQIKFTSTNVASDIVDFLMGILEDNSSITNEAAIEKDSNIFELKKGKEILERV